MTTATEIDHWAAGLDAVSDRIAPRFGRPKPRRRALSYLRGLLAPLERKNGWQLAEAAGDATPDGVQGFLSCVQWDADAVRDDLQAYVHEHLGDASAVLVLDETGFLKKGDKSAGVKRQYSGTAGRIENCQIGVFLGDRAREGGYASRHGQALIDRAHYLPRKWTWRTPRQSQARIPATVKFTTKPKQGLGMLERAHLAALPFAWITGDSVYGADRPIRRWAECHQRGYVLTVTSAQRVSLPSVSKRIEHLPPQAWQRLSAGDGAKGPRLYDWALVPHRGGAVGFAGALLVRRSIAKPQKMTFYLTHAPERTTLAKLVRVAGSRWSIESLFEQAKGEVGLDQYEVRSWIGWHHHITLAMFALAYLSVVRKGAICYLGGQASADLATDLLPMMAPEVRRLLWLRFGQNPPKTHRRPALVSLAATPSAVRTPRPLVPENTGI